MENKLIEPEGLLRYLDQVARAARQCYGDLMAPLDDIIDEKILTLTEAELIHFERSGYSDGEKMGMGLQVVAAMAELWAEKLRKREGVDQHGKDEEKEG